MKPIWTCLEQQAVLYSDSNHDHFVKYVQIILFTVMQHPCKS